MSDNTFTEVTHTGWFSRIGSAIAGVVFGLIMFLLAFPLLFWNEGRAVDRIKALDDGAAAVISVQADRVISENNKKLVHLSGLADTQETLSDSVFKVSSNALKLRREVQIYQWREETSTRTEKKLGGGEKKVTEYKYTKSWEGELADSSGFKKPGYQNPESVAYPERVFQAQSVSLGAFDLPNSLVSKINNYETIDVTSDALLVLTDGESVMPYQGGYYIGKDPAQPEVGDLRVTFSQVLPSVVSVIAQQSGNTLQRYATETGELLLLEYGEANAATMFQKAMTENTILTWVLRLAGLAVMAIGLSLVMRPISVFADVVPIFGNVAAVGIGIVSILIAVVLSFVTISLAWVWFRPLIGGLLFAIALVFAWLLKSRFKAKDTESTMAPQSKVETPIS